MKNIINILLMVIGFVRIQAQPNCNAFLYYGDTLKYKACVVSEKRSGYNQFSAEYQQALDEAIAIDPTFSFAYEAKSTAYLKSGDFVTWFSLMNKAVELNPKEHLPYRGWCRYQFFRDYDGAIKDIETLDSLSKYDIGYSVNAEYHLHIARALCYKALGQKQKALDIINHQLQEPNYQAGLFDYLHLGVLYWELKHYNEASKALIKQQEINDLAENRYYLGRVLIEIGKKDEALQQLKIAKEKYEKGDRMKDPYTQHADKIYLEDILAEIKDLH